MLSVSANLNPQPYIRYKIAVSLSFSQTGFALLLNSSINKDASLTLMAFGNDSGNFGDFIQLKSISSKMP